MVSINLGQFGIGNNNSNYQPRNNNNLQIGRKGGGWVALVIGLLVVAGGVFSLYDGEQTKDWPATTGQIQEVRSQQRYDSDGRSRTEYDYSVMYTVNDSKYSSRESSQSYVTNGQTVKLTYNPANPNDSRIGGSSTWVGWIIIAVGAGLVGVGIFMLMRKSNAASIATSTTPESASLTPPLGGPSAQPTQPYIPPAPVQPPTSPDTPPAPTPTDQPKY